MTIDIHALLEKNSITRNMVKPKFGYKCLGAYNDLENQLLYDEQIGDIYTYYDKPKNVLDKIASRHDTCYAVGKNNSDRDRVMVDEINRRTSLCSNTLIGRWMTLTFPNSATFLHIHVPISILSLLILIQNP